MSNLRIFEPSFDEPMEQMFRRFMTPWRHDKHLDVMDIRVDVVEKDDMYKVRADLPGVNKGDIKVSVDGNLVQIEAETKQVKETKEEGGKVLRSERYYGAVSRSFQLAMDIDQTQSKAKYDNGVLTLTLPKKLTSTSSQRLTID